MDLYTLPLVYSTPSMITPAYYGYPITLPLTRYYSLCLYTPISSLSLSMNTLFFPLRDIALYGYSVYSPSTEMWSLHTMLTPSTGITHDGGSLYGEESKSTCFPLHTVTLPLRDITCSPIHGTYTEELFMSHSTGDDSTEKMMVQSVVRSFLVPLDILFHLVSHTHNNVQEGLSQVFSGSEKDAVGDAVEHFSVSFLFYNETILMLGEGIRGSDMEDISLSYQGVSDDDFSFGESLMESISPSPSPLVTPVIADDLLFVEDVFYDLNGSVKEHKASLTDANTQWMEDYLVSAKEAGWNDFLIVMFSDESANCIVGNGVVAPITEYSTLDWSM